MCQIFFFIIFFLYSFAIEQLKGNAYHSRSYSKRDVRIEWIDVNSRFCYGFLNIVLISVLQFHFNVGNKIVSINASTEPYSNIKLDDVKLEEYGNESFIEIDATFVIDINSLRWNETPRNVQHIIALKWMKINVKLSRIILLLEL